MKHDKTTIIERLNLPRGDNGRYRCVCECGREFVVNLKELRNGLYKCSCDDSSALRLGDKKDGSCAEPNADALRVFRDDLSGHPSDVRSKIKGIYSSSVVYRSNKILKMKYDISVKEFADLMKLPCYYCGQAGVSRGVIKRKEGDVAFYYNGLDRVDNARGYMLDNVVPCCKRCNFAKGAHTEDEFREWVDLVYHYHINKAQFKKESECLPIIPRRSNKKALKILEDRYRNNIIRRSQFLQKSYDISFEEFMILSLSKCNYCGSQGTETAKSRASKATLSGGALKLNGIDRINNSLGYIEGNVATCCKMCNISKGDMSYDEFKN